MMILTSIEFKPTSHAKNCVQCKKPVKRNDLGFKIKSGGYREAKVDWWHWDCFADWFIVETQRLAPIRSKKLDFVRGVHTALKLIKSNDS